MLKKIKNKKGISSLIVILVMVIIFTALAVFISSSLSKNLATNTEKVNETAFDSMWN